MTKVVATHTADDVAWRLVATEHGGEIWRRSATKKRWIWVMDLHIETYNLETDGAKLADKLKSVVANINAARALAVMR